MGFQNQQKHFFHWSNRKRNKYMYFLFCMETEQIKYNEYNRMKNIHY